MSDSIDKLIGKHPEPPNFFGVWLDCKDITSPNNPSKKHRKLTESKIIDSDIILENISKWLIEHLVADSDILLLRERKQKIYEKYSYEQHLDAQELIPNDGMVCQGNFGEVVFIEYLKSLNKFEYLVYKLEYSTNVSQAMKGDDILMFEKDNLRNIILGESKYRSVASKQTVEEILESFGGTTKLPASITFVTRRLFKLYPDKSDELTMIQTEIKNGDQSILNAGLILSNKDVHSVVDNHDFYADFSLTKSVLDELIKVNPNYPIDSIKGLINTVFKNQTQLREKIQEKIAAKETGNKEERKQKAKNWTNKQYKSIIFKYSNKKLNPSLLFISIGLNDLDLYLKKSFSNAKQLLLNPDTLKLKDELTNSN